MQIWDTPAHNESNYLCRSKFAPKCSLIYDQYFNMTVKLINKSELCSLMQEDLKTHSHDHIWQNDSLYQEKEIRKNTKHDWNFQHNHNLLLSMINTALHIGSLNDAFKPFLLNMCFNI